MGVGSVAKSEQIAPDPGRHLAVQLRIGAPVREHLRLHLGRDGERSRGQQIEIVTAFHHVTTLLRRRPPGA